MLGGREGEGVGDSGVGQETGSGAFSAREQEEEADDGHVEAAVAVAGPS